MYSHISIIVYIINISLEYIVNSCHNNIIYYTNNITEIIIKHNIHY